MVGQFHSLIPKYPQVYVYTNCPDWSHTFPWRISWEIWQRSNHVPMMIIFTTSHNLLFSKVDFGKSVLHLTIFAAGCSNEDPIYET